MNSTILKVSTALLMLTATSSVCAKTTLTLSSWLPPSHPLVTDIIQPWVEQVEEATKGNVTIKILAKGLGHPKVHYDIARDGLADITYSVHGYTPGRFKMTKAVEFPFMGNSAEALSVAYWKTHEKHLAKAKEHKGVELLGLFTHGPGAIHNSKRSVKSAADLKGLKLRVGGGVVNDVAQVLELTPLLKPSSKSYELLSHGIADGTLFPLESVTAFKVQDMVKHTTTVPGGLYNTSFFLVMNEQRFSSLSEIDQQAIKAVSGEAFAKMAGKVWDDVDAVAEKALIDNGNQLIAADENFVADIKKLTANLEGEWVKEAAKKGIDGEAALADLRDFVTNYEK